MAGDRDEMTREETCWDRAPNVIADCIGWLRRGLFRIGQVHLLWWVAVCFIAGMLLAGWEMRVDTWAYHVDMWEPAEPLRGTVHTPDGTPGEIALRTVVISQGGRYQEARTDDLVIPDLDGDAFPFWVEMNRHVVALTNELGSWHSSAGAHSRDEERVTLSLDIGEPGWSVRPLYLHLTEDAGDIEFVIRRVEQ